VPIGIAKIPSTVLKKKLRNRSRLRCAAKAALAPVFTSMGFVRFVYAMAGSGSIAF